LFSFGVTGFVDEVTCAYLASEIMKKLSEFYIFEAKKGHFLIEGSPKLMTPVPSTWRINNSENMGIHFFRQLSNYIGLCKIGNIKKHHFL